jgi:hypothetical protein
VVWQASSGGTNLNRITAGDVTLIALLLLLGFYLLGFGSSDGNRGRTAVIRNMKGEVLTLDLTAERRVVVDGQTGTTEIMIGDGCVRFLSSPCPHKLCVKRGRILRAGEWIACLPNGVVVKILGDAGYDGITP